MDGKLETREDEEQNVKFLETIDLLLAAGYFRARIKGLSPFDKVVGGMTWCITTCDVDIDVDLLFQENSTIGQKIALTEKIVAVLPKMRCPHRIEPHQIQGLDFISIYPVIQWLVKRALETREELGDQIRAYSLSQFRKAHRMPEDDAREKRKPQSISALTTCKESYKPRRMYKKPGHLSEADEETQVYSTLLEYGKHGVSHLPTSSGQNQNQKATSPTQKQVDGQEQEDELKMQTLMQGMSEMDTKAMLSSQAVGSLVSLQSEEIVQVAQQYEERQAQLQESSSLALRGEKQGGGVLSHKRQVATLEKAVVADQEKLQQATDEVNLIEGELHTEKENQEKALEFQNRLQVESEKLDQRENVEENKKVLETLRSMVALNESLKKQEQEFKAQCKEELAELQSKLNEMRQTSSTDNEEEAERIQLIEDQFTKDTEKLQKIRLLLAKKNRDIASLHWKIDDVPSRAELSQYQRRFLELYNQVSSTHKETKQFFTLYNTLDDTKLYLEKEIGMLDSIHDSFETASSSSSGREQFLGQLEKIVNGVVNNKNIVEKKRNSEKSKRDQENSLLMQLVDKQRLYVKTVREFQEECKKSEVIQSKLRAAGK